MNRLKSLIASFVFTVLISCQIALANNAINIPPLAELSNNFKQIGEGTYRFLFFKVYDLELRAESNTYMQDKEVLQWQDKKNIYLKIKYNVNADSSEIVEQSVKEIERLGFSDSNRLNIWNRQLSKIMPNVEKQQILIGYYDDKGISHFYMDEKYLGNIEDDEFGKWFFSIWLSENSREPKLTKRLLGLVE